MKSGNTRKRGSLLSYLLRLMGRVLLILLIASFYQVLLYKFLPPLFTPKMELNKVSSWFNKNESVDIKYKWRSINRISSYMPLAVIAAEDQAFSQHWGFDIKAIKKAIKENKTRKRVRGASTISQQVAKNLFLWPGKNFLRKGLEAWFTILIELLWDKERIVEMYINIAEMGPGVYGVEAAAVAFFNKNAELLTQSEAALISAVLPNPIKFSIKNPTTYVLKRRKWIIEQMVQLGGLKYLDEL